MGLSILTGLLLIMIKTMTVPVLSTSSPNTSSAVTTTGFTAPPGLNTSSSSFPNTSSALTTTGFTAPAGLNTSSSNTSSALNSVLQLNSSIITSQNITIITGSCAAAQLCCPLQNNACRNGCYCDVACLRLKDCCSDFKSTCVTGMLNITNNTYNFPTYLSGSCKAAPALCCAGQNLSCFRGCFCDEQCVIMGDCCPDYNTTCQVLSTSSPNTSLALTTTGFTAPPGLNTSSSSSPNTSSALTTTGFTAPAGFSTVVFGMNIQIRTSSYTTEQAIKEGFYKASQNLQQNLTKQYSGISLRILKITKN